MKKFYPWLIAFLIFFIPTNLFFKFTIPTAYVDGLLVDYLLPKIYASDLIILSMLAMWICEVWVGKKLHLKKIKINIPNIFLKKSSRSWNYFRAYELLIGFLGSINAFFPALLILILIGNEGTLGTVQSASAVITALIVYLLGKRLGTTHRMFLLQISFLASIIGAVFLIYSFSAIGVFIFIVALALANSIQWVAVQSLNYDLIDNENRDQENQYAYVFDQEIYLNGGRILGVVMFILLIQIFSNSTALKITPIILALSQIFLLWFAKKLEKPNR